jgi:hypothetical protein
MSIEDTNPTTTSLVDRVKHILLRPRLEWPVIEAEGATVKSIFVPYAVILTAIGPLAGLIGSQLFPIRVFGSVYRPDVLSALCQALLGWGLALLAVFILSLIIEGLAPSFGGTKDRVQATKVAVYSMTAAWVAGILNLLPTLAWLGSLLGLYSFYLLYLGLPRLMKTPEDKGLIFTIVVAIASIILMGIVGGVVASIVTFNTLAGLGPLRFG